jgi:hypothetical protein
MMTAAIVRSFWERDANSLVFVRLISSLHLLVLR